jgi:pilus assembly protein Flp/PilA
MAVDANARIRSSSFLFPRAASFTPDPEGFSMLKAYSRLVARINSLRSEEDGNAAEYGLIIAIVAIGIVVGLGLLATALGGLFTQVGTELDKH